MATVTFGKLWLSDAADLTATMGFSVHAIEHDPAVAVDVRAYAGGNFRAVTQPGRQKTAKVTLGFCTDAQAAQLKDWQGTLLLYRDPAGEKFYGVYGGNGIALAPRKVGDSWSVSLTVDEVTETEEV